jgi:uncharacterized protein YqjF (DUF2071 family)
MQTTEKQRQTTARGRRFLAAEWRHLTMLNYEIDPAVLHSRVPRGTELDRREGKTYVSVVGFMFLRAKVLGVPVPFHRNFEEVNLRFYVRREVNGEVRRGVAFIKELVPRWAIATLARLVYNENYVSLPMRHAIDGFDPRGNGDEPHVDPSVVYRWKLAGRWNSIRLHAAGPAQPLEPGSLEEFIAEHYFGYCTQRDGGTIEYRVEHPPWHVWQAADAQLDCDVSQLYGPEFVDVLSRSPDTAFLADGSEVAVYRPTRL